MRQRLRQIPEIGSKLLEHPNAAGGETDLYFDKINVELKVENKKLVTLKNISKYTQQAAQYTTGCDSRSGILCVLDCSKKVKAPGSIANDIGIIEIPSPGDIENSFPLLIGIVIIRGNLENPSSYSH